MLTWRSRASSHREDGASAVEYGLLLTGIASIIAAVVFLFGGAVTNMFTNSCHTIDNAARGTTTTGMSC
jgi:pilus assembly protein Flp/PilA